MQSNSQSPQQRRAKKVPPGQPRARPINSCLTCRDRKKGCDRTQPVCGNCVQNPDPTKPCVYYAQGKAEVLKVHKRKMQSLKEDFASNVANGAFHNGPKMEEVSPHRSLAVADYVREREADDDLVNNGLRLGKLRLSECIAGLSLRKLTEVLTTALKSSAHLYPKEAQVYCHYSRPDSPCESDHTPMSTSNCLFRDSAEARVDHSYFPHRSTAESLLGQYWKSVHPVARVLHRPSFLSKWNAFWNSYDLGETPDRLHLSLVFAVLFAALVSMPDSDVQSELECQKAILLRRLRTAADSGLARSNWIHSTKLEALQAVVIYLIAVCRDQVHRAHSNIVAAALRAAEGMGLHEDASSDEYSDVEIHLRRLLWYHLLVLDIRTCEATGPRPQKRKGDFSTQLPDNVDEYQIQTGFIKDREWTDMTVMIIRFKCNEFSREIWKDRWRLSGEQVNLSEILDKIQAFNVQIQGLYGGGVDLSKPIQKYGYLLAKILVLGNYVLILHQYAFNPSIDMPDDLRELLFERGIEMIDAVQELETAPDLADWRWMSGAVQQHHYSLALLLELLKNPYLNQRASIVKGLNYVFEPPPELEASPLSQIRCIAAELRNRLELRLGPWPSRESNITQDSHDMLDLERLDFSTTNSSNRNSTTRDTSPTPLTSPSSDDQQVHPVLKRGMEFSPSVRYKASRPKHSTEFVTYPIQSCQHLGDMQGRYAYLSMSSKSNYLLDAARINESRSTEDEHKFYEMNEYSPHLSQHGASSTHSPTNTADITFSPLSNRSSIMPPEGYAHEQFEEPEHQIPFPNSYHIDDFTGFYDGPPTSPTTSQPPSSLALQGIPNDQNYYNGSELHQNTHAYADFNPYPQNMFETMFHAGDESNAQASQVTHQYHGTISYST